MPQITVNLIHDLKARHHLPKEKVPFLYGLRTGFLRAWLFTAVKVLFIFALMSGMNITGKIEENIGLLDQLIRNDFGVAQYVPPIRDNLASKATKVVNFEEGPLEPRGPALEPGSVAGEVTESNPFYPTNKNNQGKVAGDNSVAINTTTQNGQQSLEDYIDQVVRYNLVNAIAARFILPGTGDLSDGCLQIDSNNVVTTRGSRCGGGGGGSSGGGGSLAIGSAVTSGTDNSVLFVGTGGVLAQDNTNFAFDNATDALTVGGDINIGGDLIVGDLAGSGVRCLQTDNSGNVSIAAGGCGGGGSQTPWMQDIDGAGFDLQNVGNINGLIITPNTATITTGIWNGTAITDAFVSDTLTASNLVGSGSTTNAVDLATAEVNGLLPVANGGTGVSTLTSNGVLYGNATGAIQATAQGGANTVLIANNGAPSFSAAITVGTSVTSPTINATTALQVGGVDINTGSTLTNVAYLNQANVFSQNQSITGNLSVTSANTTQTTTNSALSLVANSLTSGTGLNVTSSSLTSGTLLNLNSNGTAALSGQTGLNVNLNGINGTAGQTSYGAQISNNHSGTTSTNVGLAVTVASGTTANYAATFNGGNVGIGTTQPQGLLNVMQSADDATVSTGLALYVGATAGSELTASSGTQQFAQIAPVINQSGTAGYTVLSVQSGENATGSGTKTLIDGRVDGAEMFAVRNTGAITSAVLAGGGTQCLQTNNSGVISATGSACGAGGGGDSVSVNGSGATDANFIDTAATGTIAAVTWSLNTTPSPDEISLVVGTASATEAGIVNTSSQTFAGAKTFTSNITITKDDAAILFTDSNGDTDFWAGVTEDAGNDDDDFFQIGDGSTPGTNPFLTIDTSGNVGIGTLAPDAALTVSRSGADASATFYSASATDWQGIYLSARRSRGTVSAPSDVLSGDSIVALNGYGYANSGYRFGGTLGFTLEGSPSGSNLPTYFSLWNSSAAAGGAERLRVISTGELGLGTTAPAKQLEVNSATGNNLRLTYNDSDGSATNYADLLMSSSGDLTITASGSDTLITSNLVVGSGTSATETISNTGYVYSGDDLFVAGMAGVEGNIYSDGSFIAGNGTTYGNGSITQASGQTFDVNTDSASMAFTVSNSGNISFNAPGTVFLNTNTRVTGNLAVTSVIQGGSSSVVAYSRLGTTTTGHSLGAADDLLIGDDLEVDGDVFFDGNLTVTGTCTGCGGGASTLQAAYNGGNSIETAANTAAVITETTTGTFSGDLLQLTVNQAASGVFSGDALQIVMDGTDANAFTGNGIRIEIDQSQNTGNAVLIEDDGGVDLFAISETGALTNAGAINTTVQSATALTVTRTGTNYAFQVDTNTASSATGLKVTAAAAAGGVALATISSGTNEFFTIDAKGSGEVRIGGSSTGDILLGGGSGSTGCTVTNSSGVLACTSNIASGGVLQAGSTSTVAYSRLGSTTTGHSLGAADDLLIGDDLEVDGDSFFDGNMTTAGNGFMTGFGAYFNIEQGHLCVDDSAGSACPLGGGSLGTIYAVDVNIQGIDLAETYPSKDTTLQPGELVMVDTANNEYIKRAAAGAGDLVIGVVSTDPGITLGGFKPIDYDNDRQYPIALVGRVPVKVTAENGAINSGDYLRPSATVPGAAMKAIGAGPVIGQALESFAGDGTISAFIKATYYDGGSGNLVGQGSTGGSLQGSNLGINIPGNTPLVLASHLYLTGDNIGEAKILAGDTSVRVNFDRPYEYQPIVTATPEGRVGSEYWISDKDSTGFTIFIDDESNDDITFDWHSFAGEGAKLTVSNGTQQEITLVVVSNNDGYGSGNDPGSTAEPQTEPSPEPNPDPETPPQDGGEVAGDQDTPQDNSLIETPQSE